MRSQIINWYPLSISWAWSVTSVLIVSSDNSHFSSILNWLLNYLSLILRSLLSITTELRNHSVFFDPVGVVAWSSNLFCLILILIIGGLNIFYNLFNFLSRSFQDTLLFFNYFVTFFLVSLFFSRKLIFRSLVTLWGYFWYFSSYCSSFNFLDWFTLFKSPYLNLSFFFNSNSFSFNFSLLELSFSFNSSNCFLLSSSSFISQFLDFVLFYHLFSFDSLDDLNFFFFNFF